jgi:hypothetical protein
MSRAWGEAEHLRLLIGDAVEEPVDGPQAELPCLTKGWDIIFAHPGRHEQLRCPICGRVMSVEREVYRTTSMPEAVMGQRRLVDVFHCPDASQGWHHRLGDQIRQGD